jgi:glycosyltransferase involved in cell wall biosynthesis
MAQSPIRVMHLVETLGVGGMENGIVNLANRFNPDEVTCTVCCFTTKGPWADRITNPRATVLELGYGPGRNLGAIPRFARLMRQTGVDILHCHGWGDRSFVGLLAARLARTPRCINGEHGGLFNFRTPRQKLLQRLVARRFDAIVTVSEGLRRELATRLALNPDRMTVLLNGVDTERFCRRTTSVHTRTDLGLPAGAWLVAIVGRLDSGKNQRVAVEALARMAGDREPHLLLIGEGPDRPALANLAHSLGIGGRVHFLGVRNDVPEILAMTDAMVLPSLPDYEGLPNVLLEAMASGVPVVTSDSIGVREVVDPDRTGFLFDCHDPEDLVRKLGILLNDDERRQAVIARARDRVVASFSLDAMARRYEAFYRNVLGTPRPN